MRESRVSVWAVTVVLLAVSLVLTRTAISSAQQATGTPTIYKVTVKKVEFSADGGTTFITLREADQEIDIASVNAGALAANYGSGLSLPPATYNRIRVTISCTIRLRGSVTFDITRHTTAAGGFSINAGDQAEGPYTVQPPFCVGGNLTDEEVVNFTVVQDQARTVNVDFDVTGGIRLDGAPLAPTLSPNTVTVTYTFQ